MSSVDKRTVEEIKLDIQYTQSRISYLEADVKFFTNQIKTATENRDSSYKAQIEAEKQLNIQHRALDKKLNNQ